MRLVILLFFISFSLPIFAQQLPLFSQYREYHSYINPASLNSDFLRNEYDTSFGVSLRSQWSGQPNTPQTQFARTEWITDSDWVFGGHLINDQAGPVGFSGAFGRFAYIATGRQEDNGLVIGGSFGAVQHRIRGSKIQLLEAGDVLDGIDQTRIIPDFGVGLYYYTTIGSSRRRRASNYVYGGLSLPQTFGLNLTYKTDTDEFAMSRQWHYYATVGMYIFLGNSGYLEPSAWIRYVNGAPIGASFGFRFQMDEYFWIGPALGLNKEFNIEAGFFIGENIGLDNELKLGYSFGNSFQEYGPQYGTIHEISIVYLMDNF
jgi:type IX secretion system PorP/SprF family membrane protein